MKLTADTQSFVAAVDWATKTYDTKNTKAYVALTVNEAGEAHLTHTNLTSFMRREFQLLNYSGTDAQEIALDGQFLQRVASVLNGATGSVEIISEGAAGATNVTVKSSNGKFSIPTFAAVIPSVPELVEIGEVDERAFFDALQRLARLSDPLATGGTACLSAVDLSLDLKAKKFVMMATDRYTMGEITRDFEPGEDAAAYVEAQGNILIPTESASLVSAPKGLSGAVTLVHEPESQKFGYSFADGRIALFSLRDAKPLKYQGVKTRFLQELKHGVQLDVNDLRKTIGNISSIAWAEAGVDMELSESEVAITDEAKSNRMVLAASNASLDQDYEVKFLRTVIAKAFHPIATERMNLRWGVNEAGQVNVFILEPVLDDGTVDDSVFVSLMTSRHKGA